MCYHVSTPKTELLRDIVKTMRVQSGFETNYHVSGFSRPYLPVTLNNDVDSIIEARWKLIPYWVKTEYDAEKYANTLNAKSEDIFDKASYKNVIGKYRGLLYVQGFFEPHSTDGKKNNETYYIQESNSSIFTLGIIWSTWNGYNTFSIITTSASPQMEKIHNVGKRMPLIIPESKRHNWLLANGREEIESLMVPYDGHLKSHRTYRVTSARGVETNVPTIQDEV